jgi:5-carboxymethyl-2-hydroxymuconate isomerase
MPHLTLEYSASLRPVLSEPLGLLAALNLAIAELGEGIKLNDIKSRAVCLEATLIGDGSAPQNFVHARLALMNTRTEVFKTRAAEVVLAVLQTYFEGKVIQVELCSEVQDINPACYRKSQLAAA